MQTSTSAILDHNADRDPERLKLKLQGLRRDPFIFYRGTASLFYTTLQMPSSLLKTPKVFACGDLHLENFGSYKGDNRLVYFDLNDFDEACLAPLSFELTRFLTSILVAAKNLNLTRKQALKLMTEFLDSYAATLKSGKPRWIERATATGPVKTLLQSVKNHHRRDLIARRTVQKNRKATLIIDGIHTLKASAADRTRAISIMSAYASTQPTPSHFEPIDIARRIAGNGSLGLERYVMLVPGNGTVDGHYLIDIKIAVPSALASALASTSDTIKATKSTNAPTAQPAWRSEAERVVSIQYIAQAIPPALLGVVGAGARSYVAKELQPTADRINLLALNGKRRNLSEVIRTMAQATAWSHLRGASRFGANSVESLSTFAASAHWQDATLQTAASAAQLVQTQWQDYVSDYDSGLLRDEAATNKPTVKKT